jgi:hypothetical protein
MRCGWAVRSIGVAAVLALAVPGARAAVSPELVPPERQAAILVRILAMEHTLVRRSGDAVTLAVVYRRGDADAAAMKDDVLQAFRTFENQSLQGLPLKVASREYTDTASLAAWVTRSGADVLYLCPGLERDLAALNRVAAEKQVITIGPLRPYVEQGVALGVVPVERRPKLLVNVEATKALGMMPHMEVLQLAEIVHSPKEGKP